MACRGLPSIAKRAKTEGAEIHWGDVYLPSYSPEIHPDEMANANIKPVLTKLVPARTKLQLVKATARHLCSDAFS